jgi:glycosyltransferase involved in cell wall biosynthesis
MRILLFHFAELGSLGGVEIAVLTLADALLQRGFVPAIVETVPKRRPHRKLPNGIDVFTVAASTYPSVTRPKTWASFVRATLQLRSVLGEFRPDVVHVHYPIAQCLPVAGAQAFGRRWKLVVTVHGSDIRMAPTEEPAIRAWQHRLFGHADAITAVSSALLQDAAQLYDNFRAKARVIHNGVGRQWFRLPLDSPSDPGTDYVLYVGRLHPVKGVDILLGAWKTVAAGQPDIQLWIVGDGPERQNLTALANELDISSSVCFLGARKQEDLPLLYRGARMVVLPSRREGLPIGLLEAGAAGALSVATRIPGISEVIEDGVNGFLVAPESPSDLAAGVLKVLRLPRESARTLRQAARKRVLQQFSEERIVSDYVELYQSI